MGAQRWILSFIWQGIEAQDKILNEMKENVKMSYETTISNAIAIKHKDNKIGYLIPGHHPPFSMGFPNYTILETEDEG